LAKVFLKKPHSREGVTGDIPRNHAAASRKKTDHHRVVFFLFIGAILQV